MARKVKGAYQGAQRLPLGSALEEQRVGNGLGQEISRGAGNSVATESWGGEIMGSSGQNKMPIGNFADIREKLR